MATTRKLSLAKRTLDARPDTVDFRDRMYQPTLVDVPTHISLDVYRKIGVPILDQGAQGACTGFGLAAVANYLLRTRRVVRDAKAVSARMLYYMARRYDEFPGTDDNGSSARGAMKGWHKHGVCAEAKWPSEKQSYGGYTHIRASDAALRPLGAYLRVNHRDLVAMHSAIAEVGILYASACTHDGWDQVKSSDGLIPFVPGDAGGHAFAIVAYDDYGFWIQNSWGTAWGQKGFARISYDDWLENGTDTWVARLAVPVVLRTAEGIAAARSTLAGGHQGPSFHDLRPHIVSLGNEGSLRNSGPFATTPADVDEIFAEDVARITKGWAKKRILLYAHGGLVSEDSAIQRIADWRATLLEAEIYPLAFNWKTDLWTTITNIVKDARSRRRAEGIFEGAKDFMLDRADDFLEPVARMLGGKAVWDEMKENALAASLPGRAADFVATHVSALAKSGFEVHLAGHSAGSILLAPLLSRFAEGVKIKSCTLWAPAATVELYQQTYHQALHSGQLGHLALYTLTDEKEKDDNCGGIYNKSLLYLVSNALEDTQRIPLIKPEGEPLLGMEKYATSSRSIKRMIAQGKIDHVIAPNAVADGSIAASTAEHHGDFDDDKATVRATLRRITGVSAAKVTVSFVRSASNRADLRRRILKA